MQQLSREEKQRIIQEVNASMTMENMPLTEENERRFMDILDGETSSEELRREIINRYKEKGQ